MRYFLQRTTSVLMILCLAVLLSQAQAGAATQLKWRFKAGETLDYRIEQDTKTQISGGGQEQTANMKQTMDVKWTIKSVADDGSATIGQKTTRLQFKVELPPPISQNIEFDSATMASEDESGQQMNSLLSALIGDETIIKMTAQGEIVDVQLPQKLVDQLAEMESAQQGGSVISEKGLKDMIAGLGVTFPKRAVDVGDTWEKSATNDLPFGKSTVTTTYTYAGPGEKGLEKVTTKALIALEPNPALPFEVAVKESGGDGELLFNTKLGILSSVTVNQKMTLEMKGNDQSTEQTVDQTMKMYLIPEKSK